MSVLLEAKGLTVRRDQREVLRDISLRLHAGEALALVGPNAAGKSTLLRVLTGLLPAAAGTVELGGRSRSAWGRAVRARMLALVGPEVEGPPAFTVRERAALGRFPHRGPLLPLTDEDERAVEAALTRTGLLDRAERPLDTLSAGERQLAALARGLAQQPRVLLLDEPAAHLDVGHQLQLFRLLDEVRAEGVGVLAVVHDLQRAADWAERMVLLHEGRVAAEGAPRDVLTHPACVAAFAVDVAVFTAPGRRAPLYSFAERDPGAGA